MKIFVASVLLFVSTQGIAYAEDDFEALCKLAYTQVDLGKKLNQNGTPRAQCLDEVEKTLDSIAKKNEFLKPVSERNFDRNVFLYMTIGGTALRQCLEPKEITYEQYRDDGCKSIHDALPLKR